MNAKGLASYCQECGACMAAGYGCSDSTADDSLVDLIVDEVLKSAGIPKSSNAGKPRNSVPLGVSNRHMHIREDTFKRLFGKDASLGVYRDLYQPGEFASDKTVTIVGPKMRAIQNVRILGPFRNYDQVELSLTDAVGIGISPPVRNSGDLKGSAPLTVAGPAGSVFIPECAIIANRHVHIPSAQASLWKVSEGDFIKMRIGGEKSTVFENVLVRINDSWKPQLHLDTDDANAANVRCNTLAEFEGKM